MPTGQDITPFFTPEVNNSNVKSKPTPEGLSESLFPKSF